MNNGGGEYQWAINSFFGRLNYNYKERYLVEPISVPTVLPDLQRVTDMACSLHSLQHGASARNPLWNLYAIELDNLKLRAVLGTNWATRISEVPIIPLLSNSLRALYLWEVIFTRPLLLPRSPIGTLHGRLLP